MSNYLWWFDVDGFDKMLWKRREVIFDCLIYMVDIACDDANSEAIHLGEEVCQCIYRDFQWPL